MGHVNKYFSTPGSPEAFGSAPPAPIYTLKEGRSWSLLFNDALTVGLSMAATYSVVRLVIGKVCYKALPSFPRHTWKVLAPLMAYRAAQIIAAIMIHPAWWPGFVYKTLETLGSGDLRWELDKKRKNFKEVTRFSVVAKGNTIDGVFVKPENATKGRYLVVSLGNGDFYEKSAGNFYDIAKKIQAHLVVYNYAGVGRSSGGLPSKEKMVASHRAITEMIREKLDAKQIIDFGISVGGGVMGQDYFERSQEGSQKESKVQYILAFYQTFSKTEAVAEASLGIVGRFAVRLLFGNYNPLEAVSKTRDPVVVFQSVEGKDEVIPESAGLGRHVEGAIRVDKAHYEMDTGFVAERILEKLEQS